MRKITYCNTSKNTHLKSRLTIRWLLIFSFLFVFKSTMSQNFPNNFVQVQVASNIKRPTAMAFAPDGRIFISEQKGNLLIVKNGILLAQPFLSLNVNASGERGLLGIAFDPDFSTNNHLYVYYTIASGVRNRVSRFTANGDEVVAGSEKVLLNLDALGTASNHNGGNLKFGTDGKLYVCVGENANPANSQNLNTNLGKILRINKNGTIPNDNPFKTGSAQKRSIWTYGVRNPFTMAVNSVNGKIYVNDVGAAKWEEINDITKGGLNAGWPLYEGYTNKSGYKSPEYSYAHGMSNNKGCAISGGTFFTPAKTDYPAKYNGNYFFIDYCGHWINRLSFGNNTISHSVFATHIAGSPVGITTGPDGNLYYLSIDDGALYKIKYVTSNAPVITHQPQSISVSKGSSATFSVTVSGAMPFTYKWRKNGVVIPGTNNPSYTIASVKSSDAGKYSVLVSNASGSKTSTVANLTVTQPNTKPVATITSPTAGTTYAGGTTVSFSGTATDNEDGTIPASNFTWYTVFHHSMHSHPGPSAPNGTKSGTFNIPNSGELASDVFYRLYLVVTDLQGARDTDFVDIEPRLTTLTITTSPPGLEINYDGQPFISPYIVTAVEGMRISIGTTEKQVKKKAVTYTFDKWQDGKPMDHTITVPKADLTYRADFDTVLRNPETPNNINNGLKYTYYLGSWNSIPDFESLTATSTGDISNFSLSPKTQNGNFGFVYEGYVEVPKNGIYTFYTSSDDGSILNIGTTEVVNNDGKHVQQEAQGSIGLKAGKHRITVRYFNRSSSSALDVYYKGPGIQKKLIPNNKLFYKVVDEEFKLKPVADAYVRGGNYSQNNYGNAATLLSKRTPHSNSNYRIYLRFDISALSNDISSAVLRLYGSMENNSQNAQLGVLGVDDNSWDESTINFNNKPSPNTSILETTIVTGTDKKYYEWDLKNYLIDKKKNGKTYVTLLVKNNNQTPGCFAQFNSREAADRVPQLLVVTEVPAKIISNEFTNDNAVADSEGSLQIYPNPAYENFTVTIPVTMQTCNLQIINRDGSIVKEIQISGTTIIPTLGINSGVYIVSVRNEFAVLRKRLIIIK